MDETLENVVETNDIPDDDGDDLFDSASWTDESDLPAEEEETGDDEISVESDEKEVEEKPEEAAEPSDSSIEQDQPDFLKIKYNKEEINLSRDRAIELAQKGMNYDKIHEGYQAYEKAAPFISEINRLAELNGMSPEEFMLNLSETQSQIELNREVEALREQYPNSDDSLLEELAKAHIKDRGSVAVEKKQSEDNAKRAEIERQISVFEKRYPETDPSKLDPDVYALMRDGYTLLEAYEITLSEKRAAQEKEKASREKISKQNEENRKKALGSIASSKGYDEGMSEFEKELFSD